MDPVLVGVDPARPVLNYVQPVLNLLFETTDLDMDELLTFKLIWTRDPPRAIPENQRPANAWGCLGLKEGCCFTIDLPPSPSRSSYCFSYDVIALIRSMPQKTSGLSGPARPLLHGGGSIPTLLRLSLYLCIYITGKDTREGEIYLFLLGNI